MKTQFLALAFALTLTPIVLAGNDLFSSASFDEALKQTNTEQKLVFIDFYTTWCGPCKRLDRTTWKDEKVQAFLKTHTVPLKIDAEIEVDLAKRYKINSYPTMVFINADGALAGKINGYRDSQTFLAEAANIVLHKKTDLERVREKFAGADLNDPSVLHNYGRALSGLGHYEEAQTYLLACFDKSRDSSSYVGVRNSFLIRDMGHLTQKYPPAAKELTRRRDNLLERITNGPLEKMDFIDLYGLNRALNESSVTVEVFDKLKVDKKHLETLKALVPMLKDVLLEEQHYQDIADFMDMSGDVNASLERHNQLINQKQDENALQKDTVNRMTVSSLSKYYQIYLGLSRDEEADALKKRILEVDASAATYAGLALAGKQTGRRLPESLALAKKAHELSNGKDMYALYTLADVLNDQGRKEEALKLVSDALPTFDGRNRALLQNYRDELIAGGGKSN